MKLKRIIENMDKMPSTAGGFNSTPKLSADQKRKLQDMVSRYNELGEALRVENALITTSKALEEISSLAETYACNEQQDWMAEEVVKNDFKRAKGIAASFQKIARECHGKVQQLNAYYEDFGHILERYYQISDPMKEVVTNPSNLQSQRGLPNATGAVVQEVNVDSKNKNVKSQRNLPSGGPATPQLKEVNVDAKNKNIKSQRELPHVNGPATPQLKEVSPPGFDKRHPDIVKNLSKQYGDKNPAKYATMWKLANKGLEEVNHNDKNVKSQRDLPSGGPATPQLKEETDGPLSFASCMPLQEVKPNDSSLQSQRDLPSGGPTSCECPKPENPSVPVKPAGAGEMNVKGERDVPQGGPAAAQLKEVKPNNSNLQSQRSLPKLGDFLNMK